jgi:hypothetical protein
MSRKKKKKPYHKIIKCPKEMYKCTGQKCPFANETDVGTYCNLLKVAHKFNGKFKIIVKEI